MQAHVADLTRQLASFEAQEARDQCTIDEMKIELGDARAELESTQEYVRSTTRQVESLTQV